MKTVLAHGPRLQSPHPVLDAVTIAMTALIVVLVVCALLRNAAAFLA